MRLMTVAVVAAVLLVGASDNLEELVERGEGHLSIDVCREQPCRCEAGIFVRVIDLSHRIAVFGCAIEEERT